MKASELYNIIQDFRDDYMYSDLMASVRFGCDCGCGGDSYTSEQWEDMCNAADESEAQFKKVCYQLGLEWDYD